MEGKFQKLIQRTKEVATTYTGTFVVVMLLNQLLFFGFCLNPICIIAAMPHVLFITVVIGTWLEKDKILSTLDDTKEVKSPEDIERAEAAENFIAEPTQGSSLRDKLVVKVKQQNHEPKEEESGPTAIGLLIGWGLIAGFIYWASSL